MKAEQLNTIFRYNALSANSALNFVKRGLQQHCLPLNGFRDYGKQIDLSEVRNTLEKPHFNIVGHGFEFSHGAIRNQRLIRFSIQASIPLRISWDEWMAIIASQEDFVMGWAVNSEYDHWQNAKDPLQYTAVGKPYEHLSIKSNGLPYPLEQKEIDTSANPGRWSFYQGYMEAVGSVMWLGEPFWQLSGASKDEVKAADWLKISVPSPSVMRVQAADECFTSAEGASGDMQRKLRALLFPQVASA
jgi:hypothetical protein